MIRSFCTIVATISMMAQTAHAGEPERLMDYFSHFEGQWDVVSESGAKGELDVSRGSSSRCHVLHGRLGESTLDEIFGYDPLTKKWTCVGYASSGERYTYPLDIPAGDEPKPGDRFGGKSKGMTVDGLETSDDVLFVIETKERFVVTVTNARRGDQSLPNRKLTFTRRK